MKKIIYAAYGSNLLKERFIVYIKGGDFKERAYSGCKDKTDPVECGWMYVLYRLYFAKKSSRWENKGVAFLTCEKEPNPNHYAIVRLWEITESQFEDIWNQEGKSWYNKLLYLGEKNGLEIKTFTGCWESELNPPCEEYLKIIKKGLKETTHLDEKTIEDYLNKFIGG